MLSCLWNKLGWVMALGGPWRLPLADSWGGIICLNLGLWDRELPQILISTDKVETPSAGIFRQPKPRRDIGVLRADAELNHPLPLASVLALHRPTTSLIWGKLCNLSVLPQSPLGQNRAANITTRVSRGMNEDPACSTQILACDRHFIHTTHFLFGF